MKLINLFLILTLIVSCAKKTPRLIDELTLKAVTQNKDLYEDRDLSAYRLTEYREALEKCVYARNAKESCKLNELPLIGQINSNPTVNDIMARVVTSKPWMAENFKLVLNSLTHDDIRKMARSVTAIVLSNKLTSSFYMPASGAIYLNARFLWITQEQRKFVESDSVPDPRGEYGRQLQFRVSMNAADTNGESTYYNWSPREGDRPFDKLKYNIMRLVYHELSHANDFLPATEINNDDNSRTFYDLLLNVWYSNRGTSLNMPNKAESEKLKKLAQIKFGGAEGADVDYLVTKEEFKSEFEAGYGTDFYSFFTQFEDLAMTFEEIMMLYRYKISRYVYVMESTDYTNYDYIWRQSRRVLKPEIKEKALFIVSKILPDLHDDMSSYFEELASTADLFIKDLSADHILYEFKP